MSGVWEAYVGFVNVFLQFFIKYDRPQRSQPGPVHRAYHLAWKEKYAHSHVIDPHVAYRVALSVFVFPWMVPLP